MRNGNERILYLPFPKDDLEWEMSSAAMDDILDHSLNYGTLSSTEGERIAEESLICRRTGLDYLLTALNTAVKEAQIQRNDLVFLGEGGTYLMAKVFGWGPMNAASWKITDEKAPAFSLIPEGLNTCRILVNGNHVESFPVEGTLFTEEKPKEGEYWTILLTPYAW